MPIIVQNAPVKPAITYDKVHLRELRIVLTEGGASSRAAAVAIEIAVNKELR